MELTGRWKCHSCNLEGIKKNLSSFCYAPKMVALRSVMTFRFYNSLSPSSYKFLYKRSCFLRLLTEGWGTRARKEFSWSQFRRWSDLGWVYDFILCGANKCPTSSGAPANDDSIPIDQFHTRHISFNGNTKKLLCWGNKRGAHIHAYLKGLISEFVLYLCIQISVRY